MHRPPTTAAPDDVISTQGLEIQHAGRTVLGPLDACFRPGRITAVLGPNGAGKSSLLTTLARWRRPSAGRIDWHGRDLQLHTAATLAPQRALVAQDTQVSSDFRVRELVELGLLQAHRPDPATDVAQALQACELAGLAERSVMSLSGGERARAQLARALVQIGALRPVAAGCRPAHRWLLLDEPTAALDLHHQHTMLALVQRCARAAGIGVIVVLHDLNLALRYADDALVLDQGSAQAMGPVHEVLAPPLVQRVWRIQGMAVSGTDGVPQMLWWPGNAVSEDRGG